MSRVLLTGSTGFIGKFAKIRLLDDGHDVFEFKDYKGDITDPCVWEKIPKVDIVIHAAALTFVPDSWTYSYDFFNVNFMGTICALEYCKKFKARLIFFSSYLYGNQKIIPIVEEAELNCLNPYSLSKKLGEDACKFYSDNYSISVSVIRPFNIYGPGQNDIFLIPQLLKQIINGKEVIVKDLKPKRDYVYIHDLIDLISKIIDKDFRFIVVNAGSGVSYSVIEIINIIQGIVGSNLEITSTDQNRNAEINNSLADITKAYEYFNWKPQWTFSAGIIDILKTL